MTVNAMSKLTRGAKRLAQYRDKLDVPQRAISHGVDVDQSYVSDWENGRRRPTLPQAVRLERFTDGFVKCKDWTIEI